MRALHRVCLFLIVALFLSCAGEAVTEDTTLGCEPNSAVVCPCADGTEGTQLCNADGTAFGPCDCESGPPPLGNDCTDKADYSRCDDGDQCSLDDVCLAGTCAAGFALSCQDDNACTDDACDPATGCTFSANTESCDDGNSCTENDQCAAGTCEGKTTTDCLCETSADCDGMDDTNLCNGVVECNDGFCRVDPDSVVTCEATNGANCTRISCNTDTGECEADSAADDDACTDGNTCTSTDSCNASTCLGADNQCGCETSTDCAAFDDQTVCNGSLTCVDGACVLESNTLDCDDASVCTNDSCDPQAGCQYETFDCDDGSPCTANT